MKILILTQDKKLRDVLKFCFDGWGYDVFFDDNRDPDVATVIKLGPDVVIVDVHSATPSRLAICDSLKKDFATAYIPIITLMNKRYLRQHLLDLRQGVDDYLIKPPDPLDLRIRIEMAVRRSQQSYYASPLTGLPGGIVVEDVLKDRVKGDIPFVAGHIDIDNFKSFNDKYGYMKGDRVIMQTAYMLSTSVRNWGNKGDFVGHIGGDDFVMVTTPDKFNTICRNFICMFDTIIPFHYSAEDRRNGFIKAKDRTRRVKKIPIMSVTIALVVRKSTGEMNNMIELNERIAEVKQYLKKIPGSKYMGDRRGLNEEERLQVQIFKNDESLVNSYRPLGQILLERNVLTATQLDEALKAHWKRGVLLGEVLKDMGFITDKDLVDGLLSQENALETGDDTSRTEVR